MEIMNVLAGDIAIWFYKDIFYVALDWLGELIKNLIIGVGSVGIGIILFSIILKVVVLPFDIIQRVSMRKQNLKMKENQAKMEKLQKQYANDKDLYNQKVMEMYKESGISVLSSCLPMILSIVIFFVAIGAFNAYAQYAHADSYNKMVIAYNENLQTYCVEENLNLDELPTTIVINDNHYDEGYQDRRIKVEDSAEGKYIYYTVAYKDGYTSEDINNNTGKSYYINVDKVLANKDSLAGLNEMLAAKTTEQTDASIIQAYFLGNAQAAVATAYEGYIKNDTSFLWIQNIWATDAAYKHPILSYNDFKNEMGRESFWVNNEKKGFNDLGITYTEDTYNLITAKLDYAKSAPNGFFVLIVLSIGTILLQQWLSMRSQKEQQQFGSVDGQGASQQKMTMIIMTIMFAVFSFMYSSAFSIYMIMSNVLSLVSMLIINKIVDVAEAKKAEKELKEKYEKRFHKKSESKTDKK